MRYQAIVVGLVLAATGTGLALASDIYKWTDETGNVHYADIPSGDFPERVDIESRPTDPDRVQAMMRAMKNTRPQYLTVSQAARHFTVTPETIRRWISTGKLHAGRLPGGREYRIYSGDLDLLLEPVRPEGGAR